MANPPRDDFERYFAEKLWEMIPSIYRHEDGLASNPGVLRGLVEVLAGQAAILRRSHDRLWDDEFIELCDDWAVPYLADLLGTRLVSVLNRRGRRVDVAKTIYYRRRKGTLRVLEELISDIAGWEGVAVENFRRLGRKRHGLDPFPAPYAGRLTGTPPGGWADLRRPAGSRLAHGPFDEYHHTADVRRHTGFNGRYSTSKLAFHLYRLRTFRVEGAVPRPQAGGTGFTCDPSGRDIPLFMPRNRPQDWDDWRAAREWEVPAPIACRLLGHAEYQIDEALVLSLVANQGLSTAAADDLRTLRGARFADESRLRATLLSLPNSAALTAAPVYNALLAGALVTDCGKFMLLPAAVEVEEAPANVVPRALTAAANLAAWSANAPGQRLAIDPERGRLLFLGGAPAAGSRVTYHYGFSAEIGAGTYPRDLQGRTPNLTHSGGGPLAAADLDPAGVTQLDDNSNYGPLADRLDVSDMVVQAADQRRPYVRLESDWVLDSGSNQDAHLLLDGLWIGAAGDFALVLRGDYETVTLRHCTLDPGGVDAGGNPIARVPLTIEGQVETLTVEACLLGPVVVRGNGALETLCLSDTIVQSTLPASADPGPALALPGTEADLLRATVFGAADVNQLWASEVLVTGNVDVTNTQDGCFRFSAAPAGSRLPRPYQSVTLAAAQHIFTSQVFGHPGYGQLSETAPVELLRGAENGSEIGAFSGLLNPVRLDSLRIKLEEFMPFGLIPIIVMQT